MKMLASNARLAISVLFAATALLASVTAAAGEAVHVTTAQGLVAALKAGDPFIHVTEHLDFSTFPLPASGQALLPEVASQVAIWGTCPYKPDGMYNATVPAGTCVLNAAGRGRLFVVNGFSARLWLGTLALVGSTTVGVATATGLTTPGGIPSRRYADGGSVHVFLGSLYLEDLLVMSGASAGNGGAIAVETGFANLTNVRLTANNAADNGGGLFSTNSNTVLKGVIIEKNSAAAGLAAYFEEGANSTITGLEGLGTNKDLTGKAGVDIGFPVNGTTGMLIYSDKTNLWPSDAYGTFMPLPMANSAEYLSAQPPSSVFIAEIQQVMATSEGQGVQGKRKGLFDDSWRVALMASCLSLFVISMICICYFCYRIQRLTYVKQYSFSTKILQYDNEDGGEGPAQVEVPMTPAAAPDAAPPHHEGRQVVYDTDAALPSAAASGVMVTVVPFSHEGGPIKSHNPYPAAHAPAAVGTRDPLGHSPPVRQFHPPAQALSPPPRRTDAPGLEVQEVEMTDAVSGRSGRSGRSVDSATLPAPPMTHRMQPAAAVQHSPSDGGGPVHVSPALRPPPVAAAVQRSPVADSNKSAIPTARQSQRAARAAAAPAQTSPPPRTSEEIVSERLADFLHLSELENDVAARPAPPLDFAAPVSAAPPREPDTHARAPNSMLQYTELHDGDAAFNPLYGSPVAARPHEGPVISDAELNMLAVRRGVKGDVRAAGKENTPQYAPLRHVTAGAGGFADDEDEEHGIPDVLGEGGQDSDFGQDEQYLDASEHGAVASSHPEGGSAADAAGPSNAAGSALEGEASARAGSADEQANSELVDPEMQGQRRLKYARRGLLDRRKPEGAGALMESASPEEGPGRADMVSATTAKNPFSNPGGGWKRNPFSRKTAGAAPGKLSGRSSRKKAQKRMMLNRAETPSASLFAISEDAEIRYTNGGVLYEVPGSELHNTIKSVASAAPDGVEDGESESESFSESDEEDEDASSSVDSKDLEEIIDQMEDQLEVEHMQDGDDTAWSPSAHHVDEVKVAQAQEAMLANTTPNPFM